MPKPKREFPTEQKAWDDLLDAIREAVNRRKAQGFKEAMEYTPPGPWIRKTHEDRQIDLCFENF